jgi:hypothetical protein
MPIVDKLSPQMVPTRLIVTVQIKEARVAGFSIGRQASNWNRFKPAVDYILGSEVSLT